MHHTVTIPSVEAVAPFFMAIIVLLLSVILAPELKKVLTTHYSLGWSEGEIRNAPADRSPETHAKVIAWIIDVAQIPAVVCPTIAGVIVSSKAYSDVSWLIYTFLLFLGLVIYHYYKSKINILEYADIGWEIRGYRISPLVAGGVTLNVVAGILVLVLT